MKIARAGLMALVWAADLVSHAADRAPGADATSLTAPPILVIDADGHTGWTNRVLYWPYKNELITVSHDKSIRFWDLETGQTTRTLRPPIGRGNAGRLHAASLSPDNKLLAVGGESALRGRGDHAVYLIDPVEGRIVKSLAGHPSPIRCIAFSPDGRQLATSCYDEKIRLFDVATGAVQSWNGHADSVVEMAWSPDGRSLVSGSWDRTARIWDVAAGTTRMVLSHPRSVLAVAWSPDARSVATGSSDRSVRLWGPDGSLRQTWPAAPEHIDFLSFSPESSRLLYGWGGRHSSEHGSAVVDLRTGSEVSRFLGQRRNALDGLFLPDGKTVVTCGFDGEVIAWDAANGKVRTRMAARGAAVSAAGWSPDDRAIGWADHCRGNSAIKGSCPLTQSFCLNSLNFGPVPDHSFQQAISQSAGYEIQRTKERVATVWQNGGVISQYQIPNQDAKIRCRTLLARERAAVGCDYGLYVFNTQTGQGIYTLPGHSDAVLTLAPSVSQRYLLSGSIDHTLEIWNIETYEHLVSLYFAGNEWIAWTPQGYYAASVGGESLMGWHVNQGPDQLGQFYPASRFHAKHYRPDVIRSLIESTSVRAAVAVANARREATESPALVSLTPPPTVVVTADAADRAQPASSPLRITAAARPQSDDVIVALRVLVNARPFETRRMHNAVDAKPAEVTESFTLNLPPGRHQIVVRADTARSYELSAPHEVIIDGNAPDDSPTLYILAIGTDAPSGATGNPAAFGKDAAHVGQSLRVGAGRQYRRVELKRLAGPEASLGGIREGLEWLASRATASDAAVIYFATLAMQNERGDVLLMPSDRRANEGGLTATELLSRLARIRARLMLWADWRSTNPPPPGPSHDFCGASSAGNSGAENTSAGAAIDDLLRELVGTEHGVAVISANSGTRVGVSPPDDTVGWFARALAEGLGGRAATDGVDGVSLSELEEYVKQRVGELSGNRWRPNVGRSSLIPSIPLTKP